MNAASNGTLPLKDIHLPPAISAWPPAPGWWISAIVLIVIVAAVCYFITRHRRRTAYRRAALIAARHCSERFQQHQDSTLLATECSELLRRVALAAYGKRAAGISGTSWLQFLDGSIAIKKSRRGKSPAASFSSLAPALLEAPYRPGVDYDTQALQRALRHWIRHHKPSNERTVKRKAPH